MKGIVLAGGSGTRLHPITKAVNKHLLPVYDKPMIYYPLSVMKNTMIKDILVIIRSDDYGNFLSLLGDGEDYDLNITYAFQDEPKGIADAFLVAEDCGFLTKDDAVALILGDNVFIGDEVSTQLRRSFINALYSHSATIFTYHVADPERYGVVRYPEHDEGYQIIEKPTEFVSNCAVVGLYCYPAGVADKVRELKPSARGELEITDLNNMYFDDGAMMFSGLSSSVLWADIGTHDALLEAGQLIKSIQERTGKKIGDINER